jgi:hypothetical protein
MRIFAHMMVVCGLVLSLAPASWALEARPLTQDDIGTYGGTDFDGGVGDLLLQNDKVWAVILNPGETADFGIPFTGEALPSSGVLIDVGTVTNGVPDKNDQLTEIHQLLNLDQHSLILYGQVVSMEVVEETASITVAGIALFPEVSDPDNPTLPVMTTYSLTNGNAFIDISTTVTNTNPFPVPIFQISDLDIFAGRSRLPFQPFPNRGTKPPPLDIGDPFAAIGVFPYLSTVGNNGPENGPVNNDGSPSEEVSYTYVPLSIATPLIGIANGLVAVTGNFFDLAAVGAGNPPELASGHTFTYRRRLAVSKRNDVESGLDIALPLLGLDTRATFTGRVVDGYGKPVPKAHLVFDNTFPGADPGLEGLVTVLDENQDGEPDGVIQVKAGDPVPWTHVVTDAQGKFTVKLPALVDPTMDCSTSYNGRIQAAERDTATIGLPPGPPLCVNLETIFGGPTDLGDILVSNTGTLTFAVRDLTTGRRTPAQLRIFGILGTENPDLGSQYLSLRNFSGLSKRRFDGLDPLTYSNTLQLSETLVGFPALNVTAESDGRGSVHLKPGRYVVRATRGLEYTTDAKIVRIAAGRTQRVTFEIQRVVDTSGFISMDFHVHSTRSFDSSAPLTDRVVSYAAKGVEVLVSTDHDHVTDYAPIIQDLHLDHKVASIVGNELTGSLPVPPEATAGIDAFPEGIGHWNAWPLELNPGARRDGAPADELITPGTAIDRLRGMDSLQFLGVTPDTAGVGQWLAAIQAGQPGTPGASLPPDEEIVMLTHPRAGLAGLVVIGLFNSLANPGGDPATGGYDPTKLITEFPNNLLGLPSFYNAEVIMSSEGTDTTGLSFDAIEVFNSPALAPYLAVREDWFSLLKQGIHKTATAVTDSHRVIIEHVGFPRSFVASSTDDPAVIDEDELTQNVKAMQVVGTTGPFVRVSVGGDDGRQYGLGEVVVATQPKVRLKLHVEAAPWIPVEEVRIYRNGELIKTIPMPIFKILGSVVRLHKTVRLQNIDRDSFLTVEAGMRIDANGTPQSPFLVQLVQQIEPGIVPLAFTNPIFVDRDGNGYEPPGL